MKDGFNLERRVADFAARCLDVCEALPRGRADELVRIFNASISTARKRLSNDE